MDVLDIFSWLPKEEMTLEEIESIAIELYRTRNGKTGFSLEMQVPQGADENVIGVKKELVNEGKKVCFLMKDGAVIAAIGYKDIIEINKDNPSFSG